VQAETTPVDGLEGHAEPGQGRPAELCDLGDAMIVGASVAIDGLGDGAASVRDVGAAEHEGQEGEAPGRSVEIELPGALA
jgi:hypothetical protein